MLIRFWFVKFETFHRRYILSYTVVYTPSTGNLKLIAEYFQRSETFGGASRDWIGIYEECAT